MKNVIKGFTILAIGLVTNGVQATAIEYENKYPDEVPYIDIYSLSEYGNADDPNAEEMTFIWEDSPEVRNNSYYTLPHTIVKENGKVKYALAHVRGAGYSMPEPLEDLVLINCAPPRESYIERGDRERISLRDSMAIGGEDGLRQGDEQWGDYIPRGAVAELFNYYCK